MKQNSISKMLKSNSMKIWTIIQIIFVGSILVIFVPRVEAIETVSCPGKLKSIARQRLERSNSLSSLLLGCYRDISSNLDGVPAKTIFAKIPNSVVVGPLPHI